MSAANTRHLSQGASASAVSQGASERHTADKLEASRKRRLKVLVLNRMNESLTRGNHLEQASTYLINSLQCFEYPRRACILSQESLDQERVLL